MILIYVFISSTCIIFQPFLVHLSVIIFRLWFILLCFFPYFCSFVHFNNMVLKCLCVVFILHTPAVCTSSWFILTFLKMLCLTRISLQNSIYMEIKSHIHGSYLWEIFECTFFFIIIIAVISIRTRKMNLILMGHSLIY